MYFSLTVTGGEAVDGATTGLKFSLLRGDGSPVV